MQKWSYKYWLLKWQVHRDYNFLVEKSFLKAKSEGLEINVGTQFILIVVCIVLTAYCHYLYPA